MGIIRSSQIAIEVWGGISCFFAVLMLIRTRHFDRIGAGRLSRLMVSIALLLFFDALSWFSRDNTAPWGYYAVRIANFCTFLMQFVHDKRLNSDYWYIQPKVSKPQKNTRLVGEFDTMALYHTEGFTGLTQVEQKLFNFLKIGKYCFSDNLTGTLWKKCYKEV